MQSFANLERSFSGQPRELAAILARIDTGRGKEELFLDQRPELLTRLSENARIESITASNAIEGVLVDSDRAIRIAQGTPRFRNRNEKEFAGYRDAIDGLMRAPSAEELSVAFVLHLHRELFKYADGRGGHLKMDQNLIVSRENGSREVIFTPPPPERTEFMLTELVERYNERKAAGDTHPLSSIGALVIDLLAIHPVADGNGRLARLVTTHELLAHGYGVARYVSLEQRILESKNTYYQRIYESQRGWHQAQHSIWPWTSYLALVLAGAYEAFEAKVLAANEVTGTKQDQVRKYILEQAPAEFRRRDIEGALADVSPATVRVVLNELRDAGRIETHGGGPNASWRRL